MPMPACPGEPRQHAMYEKHRCAPDCRETMTPGRNQRRALCTQPLKAGLGAKGHEPGRVQDVWRNE
eukprot:7038261-Lingulodinium_polyedra.AAC.1